MPNDSPIYLNHAGTSYPKPPEVLAAIEATLRADPGEYPAIFLQGRRRVAGHLGVDEERLLLTPSCTHALDVAISELAWESGDAVVTSHLEHQAVLRPVRALSRLGVTHHRSPYSPGEPFDLEWLERTLSTERVRLVVLSVASNVTGEILPVAEVSRLAHAKGALVLADAAQAFGLLRLRAREWGCDLLAFAGHKGPLGPQGIGGLWASADVAFAGCTVACSVERAQSAAAEAAAAMPGYCDVGGVNVAGLAGLAAGLEAFGEGRQQRMDRACSLAKWFAEEARAIQGVEVFGHAGAAQTATISLRHERLPTAAAEARLLAHGIRVRAGLHCAPDALEAIGTPGGTIRVSFGSPSTPEHVRRALEALRSGCA